MSTNYRTLRFAFLTGMAIVLLQTPAIRADQRGDCFRADLDAPVVLPDGSIHEAGSLKVCLTSKLNPVSGLHTTSVNEIPIGLFRSRVKTIRGSTEAEGATIVFDRSPSGQLTLDGYRVVSGGRATVYALAPNGSVTSDWQLAKSPVPAPDRDSTPLRVSANR